MSLQNSLNFQSAEQFNDYFKNYFKDAKDFNEEFDRLPKPINRQQAEEMARDLDYEYGYARNPDYDVKESPLLDVILRGQKALDEQKETEELLKKKEEENNQSTDRFEMTISGSMPNDNDDNDDDKDSSNANQLELEQKQADQMANYNRAKELLRQKQQDESNKQED